MCDCTCAFAVLAFFAICLHALPLVVCHNLVSCFAKTYLHLGCAVGSVQPLFLIHHLILQVPFLCFFFLQNLIFKNTVMRDYDNVVSMPLYSETQTATHQRLQHKRAWQSRKMTAAMPAPHEVQFCEALL